MSQPLALIFPGQGSQQLGMLRELAERYSVVGTTFEEASDALGYDLWKVVQEGPEEALNSTACTQPALLTSSVAIWRVWQELEGPRPARMAGHSLGEYSAMVCAGVIGFAEGVKLVAVAVAVTGWNTGTTAGIDLTGTVANPAGVKRANAVVDIVADAVAVRIRSASAAADANGIVRLTSAVIIGS